VPPVRAERYRDPRREVILEVRARSRRREARRVVVDALADLAMRCAFMS